MVASLLKLAGLDWDVPDYTTLCRRQKTLAVQTPYRRIDSPLNLLVDIEPWERHRSERPWRGGSSSSATANGRHFGHPRRGIHSQQRRRQSGLAGTARSDPEGEEIGAVTAAGAHDTRRCHTAIIDRQTIAIIPIRKNGRPWKEDCPAATARNETHRATRHYGRAFWKRWTRDTTPGAGSRRRCPRRFARTCGAQPARPQGLWRTHFRKRAGPPDRRNPHPHRTHEPLLGPRNGRDRARGLTIAFVVFLASKGAGEKRTAFSGKAQREWVSTG